MKIQEMLILIKVVSYLKNNSNIYINTNLENVSCHKSSSIFNKNKN